jgi:hypothetical protein
MKEKKMFSNMQLRQSPATGFPTTSNKNAQLHTDPHYTDRRFKQAQTIFGERDSAGRGHAHLTYVYSDRLRQWDYDKHESAWEKRETAMVSPRAPVLFLRRIYQATTTNQ